LCGGRPQKRKREEEDEWDVVSKKPANGSGIGATDETRNNGVDSGRKEVDFADANTHTNGENGFRKPASPKNLDNPERIDSPTSTVEDKDHDIERVLTKFVNFALQHPKVLASPAQLRRWLALELQTFLLAHVTHMEDCEALAQAADMSTGSVTWSKPRTTFFNWVRTTSADHTSCPYSFVFFLCLIGESGWRLDMSTPQRYALEDGCRHLAAMCRQYNDLGSVLRDQEEKNLNSVNFPEFAVEGTDTAATVEELTLRKKRDLLAVAEYERRCLGHVMKELEPSLDARVMDHLELFIQVTDLYGQIYVVRDIGIRHVEENGKKTISKAS
jgi:hypothetical protein